jgi:hypothetical protein
MTRAAVPPIAIPTIPPAVRLFGDGTGILEGAEVFEVGEVFKAEEVSEAGEVSVGNISNDSV